MSEDELELMRDLNPGFPSYIGEPLDYIMGEPISNDPFPIFNGVSPTLVLPKKRPIFTTEIVDKMAHMIDITQNALTSREGSQTRVLIRMLYLWECVYRPLTARPLMTI